MVAPPPQGLSRPRWRPSILLVLMLGFGGLTVAAAGTVTLIGYDLARRNTYDLIAIASRSAASELRTAFSATLDPAENAVRYLAGAIERGELDPAGGRNVRVWPELRMILRNGESQSGLDWHGIIYVPSLHESFIVASWPVIRGQRYLGIAIAGVPLTALSNMIAPDVLPGTVDFLLRGRGEVLAHPSLAGG